MKKDYLLFVAIIALVLLNFLLSRTGGESTFLKVIIVLGILVLSGIFVFTEFFKSRREKKAAKEAEKHAVKSKDIKKLN